MGLEQDIHDVVQKANAEAREEIRSKILAALGESATPATPAAPQADAKPRTPRAERRAPPTGEAPKFALGQRVSYAQGRGSFDATVVSISSDGWTLAVRRVQDGKQVERGADKVSAI